MQLINIISDRLIHAIAWTFVHSMWQTVIISLLLGILLLLFRKSARVKYLLSTISMSLILLMAVFSFIKIYNNNYVDSTNYETVLQFGINDSDKLIPDNNILSGELSFQTAIARISSVFNGNTNIIVGLWFLGIIILGSRFIKGLVNSGRIKYMGTVQLSTGWKEKVCDLQSAIKLSRPVRILESLLATVPMVIGYLKPVILLPLGTISGIPADQVEAIIIHELAHIKRNDYLVNIFQSLMEVFFFFNPAVWWISGIIRNEREHCCDDIVINVSGGALVYARALISIEERSKDLPTLAVALTGNRQKLLNRIKRITKMSQSKLNITDKWMAITMIVILVSGIAMVSGLTSCKTANAAIAIENEPYEAPVLPHAPTDPVVIQGPEVESTSVPVIIPQDKKRISTSGSIQTDWIDPADNKEKKVEMKLEYGEVTELIIDGEIIPAEDYIKYKELIDDTIEELKKAEEDIAEAQEDIEEAIRELNEIDFAEMEVELEEALIEMEEIDFEEIEIELEETMKELETIDFEEMKLDIEEAMQEIENIDFEEMRLEMKEAMEEMEKIDFEKMKIDIENSMKDIELIDIEEMKKELEKARIEMEKSIKEFKENHEFDIEKIKKELEQEKKELEKQLIEMQKKVEKKKVEKGF